MSVPDSDPLPETPSPVVEPIPSAIQNVDVASPGPGQYEFSHDEEKIIGDLGWKMRVVGVLTIAFALLDWVAYLVLWRVARFELSTLVTLLFGIWTLAAGRSFQRVASTRGRDITNLLEGLGRLRWFYSLLLFLMSLVLVVEFILLLASAPLWH